MLVAPSPSWLRRVWRKIAMRNLTGRDNHAQLERLYLMPDPWQMESAREQARFRHTSALIGDRVGRVTSLLEIGCGEGHQSQHLVAHCDQLFGIDVSERAVGRARTRVPQAQFAHATLDSLPWTAPQGRFDLIVACEVLYYVRDVPDAVARMSALGDHCLVTFFGPAARVVAPHLSSIPRIERGWFYHDPYPWMWAFWTTR